MSQRRRLKFYLQGIEQYMALLQAKEVGDIRDDMWIVFVLDNQLPRSRFCHFHLCLCSLSPPLHLQKKESENRKEKEGGNNIIDKSIGSWLESVLVGFGR